MISLFDLINSAQNHQDWKPIKKTLYEKKSVVKQNLITEEQLFTLFLNKKDHEPIRLIYLQYKDKLYNKKSFTYLRSKYYEWLTREENIKKSMENEIKKIFM